MSLNDFKIDKIDFSETIVTKGFLDVYEEKSKKNKLVINLYEKSNFKSRAKKVANCASTIKTYKFHSSRKIKEARFCKDRFCSICQFIKSKQRYGKYSLILSRVVDELFFVDFIHLTLTVENSHYLNALEVKSKMFKAWSRFTSLFKKHNSRGSGRFKYILGGMKAVELVVEKPYYISKERDSDGNQIYKKRSKLEKVGLKKFTKIVNGEYLNLHIHSILTVDKRYFDDIITTKEWSSIWGELLAKESYHQKINPIVHLNRVYVKNSKSLSRDEYRSMALKKAVLESVKYSVKSTDLKPYEKNIAVFKKVVSMFNNSNLWSDYGIVKEYRQLLDRERREKKEELKDFIRVEIWSRDEKEIYNNFFDILDDIS